MVIFIVNSTKDLMLVYETWHTWWSKYVTMIVPSFRSEVYVPLSLRTFIVFVMFFIGIEVENAFSKLLREHNLVSFQEQVD